MIETTELPKPSPSLMNRKPCRAISLAVSLTYSILAITYIWFYLLASTGFGREFM